MSTIPSSQLDFVPRQEDSDQLFDTGNLFLSVVYLENIELSIENCFVLINHGFEPTKPLHSNKTINIFQKKLLKKFMN